MKSATRSSWGRTMRAVLATCIAGAMTFAGVIWLVGGSRPGAIVPDASPAAVPEEAPGFEPSVPGHFLMPGFPNGRVSLGQLLRQGAASDVSADTPGAPILASVAPDAGAEKTGSFALASVPPTSVEPATRAEPASLPPAV